MIRTSAADAARFRDVAMAWAPELTACGVIHRYYKQPLLEREGIAYETLLRRDREAFRQPDYLEQIAASADWIRRQPTVKTARVSSYTLKHDVENWFERRGSPVYVANGAFIAAAIGLGVPHHYGDRTPNWRFGFSTSRVKRERAALGPDPADPEAAQRAESCRLWARALVEAVRDDHGALGGLLEGEELASAAARFREAATLYCLVQEAEMVGVADATIAAAIEAAFRAERDAHRFVLRVALDGDDDGARITRFQERYLRLRRRYLGGRVLPDDWRLVD